ncbi:hypothetical protein [Saccharothrix sp.]|uniref:hypothetical protein n=1 Tax=Saccharothrix sp. TaxID=1873460 RepID=UPI0028111CF4|nr:hypothetical protein [Saccharothrix sp.]
MRLGHKGWVAVDAVAEERLLIARDVHGVVGDNLSLIAMRAAVANHLRYEAGLADV